MRDWSHLRDLWAHMIFTSRDLVPMQYTGLKDKNGKEIYEGDIIACDYYSNVNPRDYSDSNYFDSEPRKRVVEWKGAGFKASGYVIEPHRSLVIGNIHENPS